MKVSERKPAEHNLSSRSDDEAKDLDGNSSLRCNLASRALRKSPLPHPVGKSTDDHRSDEHRNTRTYIGIPSLCCRPTVALLPNGGKRDENGIQSSKLESSVEGNDQMWRVFKKMQELSGRWTGSFRSSRVCTRLCPELGYRKPRLVCDRCAVAYQRSQCLWRTEDDEEIYRKTRDREETEYPSPSTLVRECTTNERTKDRTKLRSHQKPC